jgi:hypothetical protein
MTDSHTLPYSKTNELGHPVITVDEFVAFIKANGNFYGPMKDFFNDPVTKRFMNDQKCSTFKECCDKSIEKFKESGESTTEIVLANVESKTDTHFTISARVVFGILSLPHVMKGLADE